MMIKTSLALGSFCQIEELCFITTDSESEGTVTKNKQPVVEKKKEKKSSYTACLVAIGLG